MGSQCSMQGAPSACRSSRCLHASVASDGVVRGLRSAPNSVLAMSLTPYAPY
jgi:hypothetical protein